MKSLHKSVLYKESLAILKLKAGDVVVDGTLGGAGHAQGILDRIMPSGMLIGIDKDSDAIARGEMRLAQYKSAVRLVRSDFKEISKVLDELEIKNINAALLDLGVSSFQLDEKDRGFSYKEDAPLDMRMNNAQEFTAKDVLNGYTTEELSELIHTYGEEKWAARIAEFITEERKNRPIETTGQLVTIIKKAIPKAARRDGPHPAKRTFQAIRIEVNNELGGLKDALECYTKALSKNGRLAVISFHSLEDRIVKQEFKRLENPCECPKDFPICVCGNQPLAKVVTRKPIVPTEQEVEENPRARSAKLRAVERI